VDTLLKNNCSRSIQHKYMSNTEINNMATIG